MFSVLVYRGTGNLGDAIQTVALSRLLRTKARGVYRDEPIPRAAVTGSLILNGWLSHVAPNLHANCIYAGVHIGKYEAEHIANMRAANARVGARDPYTAGLLTSAGVPNSMIGCATLTLDRYRGVRRGRYSIDVPTVEGTVALTQSIADLSWSTQWKQALTRLEQLRTASVVFTTRLHVILPCLAFGTPVVFPLEQYSSIVDKHRLTLLHHLGFHFGEAVTLNVDVIADAYVRFLSTHLHEASSVDPSRRLAGEMPVPLNPYSPSRSHRRERLVTPAAKVFYICADDQRQSSRSRASAAAHVRALRNSGVEAYIVELTPLAASHGRTHVVPLETMQAIRDGQRDVLVIPSGLGGNGIISVPGNKVILHDSASKARTLFKLGYSTPFTANGVIGVLAIDADDAALLRFAYPTLTTIGVVGAYMKLPATKFVPWKRKKKLIALVSDVRGVVSFYETISARAGSRLNRGEEFRWVDLRKLSYTTIASALKETSLLCCASDQVVAKTIGIASGCVVAQFSQDHDTQEQVHPSIVSCSGIIEMVRYVEHFMEEFPQLPQGKMPSPAYATEMSDSLTQDCHDISVLKAWRTILVDLLPKNGLGQDCRS